MRTMEEPPPVPYPLCVALGCHARGAELFTGIGYFCTEHAEAQRTLQRDYPTLAMRNRPRMLINRRHARVQRLLAHVIHTIEPYLAQDANLRDYHRDMEELFFAQGVDIITEGMRAEAGLPARDQNGMTLEEIKIIEGRLIESMLRGPPPMILETTVEGDPSVTLDPRHCPRCGFLGEPAK